ncbi:unnamed protein product [Brassica rapa subsp. narinosa]
MGSSRTGGSSMIANSSDGREREPPQHAATLETGMLLYSISEERLHNGPELLSPKLDHFGSDEAARRFFSNTFPGDRPIDLGMHHGLAQGDALFGNQQHLRSYMPNTMSLTGGERLQQRVKAHLQNLSRQINLGQATFEEISTCSIHTILAACGLEHKSSEVHFVPPSYRNSLRSVRAPMTESKSGVGPVIEMASTSLLHPKRSYTPVSTEDPGTSSKGAVTVGLPPDWVDVSEEISVNIQRARTKMAELGKAHAKALMPSFGDGKEDQHQIESLTQEVTFLLRKSEKQLQRLSKGGPSEDSSVRKNVQRSLATDLQQLSMELRKKQSTYLKRLRLQKEDGGDLEMNLNGSSSRAEDDDFDDILFSEHQMSKIKKSEEISVEREKEIQQVVESVNELAQIMKDLSALVIDQGTIVDRIDYNIQNVSSTVEDGLKQLQKAERTQRSGGMVKCASVLVILCFIMLVLLILKEIIF